MVMVIIGILAAVVGPRFFDRRVFDERLFYEESLAAVRYAQKLALASGCPVRARIPGLSPETSGYALSYAAPCNGAVADPSGDAFEAILPSGVAIGKALDVTFNPLGCVSNTNTCPSDPSPSSVSAEIGEFSFQVHVATGFIESSP